MAKAIRSKKATDEVLGSCERVAQYAKAVTESLVDRKKRLQTEPFFKISEFDEEDSLVTSIENVVAAKKQ